MNFLEEIEKFTQSIPANLEKQDGIYVISFVIAERKAFLTRKKLEYIARFKINEEDKEISFTEMLKEKGFGLSSGGGDDLDISPGFGFKKETYNTTSGAREGGIEEQSKIFGKDYQYNFDYQLIRKKIQEIAQEAGYKFSYQIAGV